MKTITSKLHTRQRNYLLIFGLLYLGSGIVIHFTEGYSLSNWWHIILGIGMLALLGYRLYTKGLFSVIKWNEEKLVLKAPEQKHIVFKRNQIKSLKLTDKSLTINAGLGSGEMFDLNYFKAEDIAFFNKDFIKEEATQPEAYSLAEA